jgi:hypothetical protein
LLVKQFSYGQREVVSGVTTGWFKIQPGWTKDVLIISPDNPEETCHLSGLTFQPFGQLLKFQLGFA